jgi:hypothetical protein
MGNFIPQILNWLGGLCNEGGDRKVTINCACFHSNIADDSTDSSDSSSSSSSNPNSFEIPKLHYEKSKRHRSFTVQ